VSSFHKGAGLVGPATLYNERSHGNKHEVSGASPKWTVFICHVAIPGCELPRTPLPRTPVNKGKRKGRGVISPGPRLFLPQYWVPTLS
jgi:hypothetical protein